MFRKTRGAAAGKREVGERIAPTRQHGSNKSDEQEPVWRLVYFVYEVNTDCPFQSNHTESMAAVMEDDSMNSETPPLHVQEKEELKLASNWFNIEMNKALKEAHARGMRFPFLITFADGPEDKDIFSVVRLHRRRDHEELFHQERELKGQIEVSVHNEATILERLLGRSRIMRWGTDDDEENKGRSDGTCHE
jgi:hypothetical protein